jgi:hypothetical protein
VMHFLEEDLLFLQQSSVEWCSSLWLDSIREIDPTFRRTIIVVSKFDNRLKVLLSHLINVFVITVPQQLWTWFSVISKFRNATTI